MALLEMQQVIGHLAKVNPTFCPGTVGEVETELDNQVPALEDKAQGLRLCFAQTRPCSIRDFWPTQLEQVTLRWLAIKGAVDVRSFAASGLSAVKDPAGLDRTITEAEDVVVRVREYWQGLYTQRDVNLPWLAEQVQKHIRNGFDPQEWDGLYDYYMDDLDSSIAVVLDKALGTNRITGRLLQSLPQPIKWLLVHANGAILRGASPPSDGWEALSLPPPKG